MKQLVGQAPGRRSDGSRTACSGVPQRGSLAAIPGHVVGDEEVQPAVVVVVEPAGGDGPQLADFGSTPVTPAFAVTSAKRPLPRLRYRMLRLTPATKISAKPSLSKSAVATAIE